MIFYMFFYDFKNDFLMGSKGFWQGSSLQVLQNAANTYVETRNHKKDINEI